MTDKTRKGLSIAANVLTVIIILFTVLMLIFTIISVTAVGNSNRTIFGSRAYIVMSDSMHGFFNAGDVIFVKVTDDVFDLEVGTVITFISEDPDSFGEVITHRIVGITDEDGELCYVTKGDANDSPDRTPVPAGNVIGVYSARLPGLGYFFNFLRTPAGYVVLILLPFLLIFLLNGGRLVKLIAEYRKQKKAEREELVAAAAADREEARRLREEMDALKARLGMTDSQSSAENSTSDSEEHPSTESGAEDSTSDSKERSSEDKE